jgi:hypothetical protein
MATNVTEIYVSTDNEEFTKLDLYKDESFVMKYAKKDLQDISKVFAPFSQNFTFPTTPKNKQALGFFGNTEVIKILPDSKYYCKIYINGLLDEVGILKLEGVKYKNNKADSFTANFNTNILSLKDRLGDDTITDLGVFNISWMPNTVRDAIRLPQLVGGLSWFTPLMSRNRVWFFSTDNTGGDNIHYKNTNTASGDGLVKASELRPAVSLKSLFDLVKQKYNLNISMPLENRPEFTNAFIYCNGENFMPTAKKLILTKNYSQGNFITGRRATVNTSDSSITIERNTIVRRIRIDFIFQNVLLLDKKNNDKARVTIFLVNKDTGERLPSFDAEFQNGNNTITMTFNYGSPSVNTASYFVNIQSDTPMMWENNSSNFFFFAPTNFLGSYTGNNTSLATGLHNVNLLNAIPETKVIDFLTSVIKTYNISIFKSDVEEDILDFLTPEDIKNTALSVAFREKDYTRFTDTKAFEKKALTQYDYYKLKHKDSKYKSNADFLQQFGVPYGQASFPEIKPDKANEFIIETGFSIIPPVTINGLEDVITAYGFTAEAPQLESGRFRYSSNNEDLTIFLKEAPVTISQTLGCQTVNSSGVVINGMLTSYQPVKPFITNFSFGFSILVFNSVSYLNTLYKKYYEEQIQRLLNVNTMEHNFEMMLPASEMVVSKDTMIQPNGFRLQNTIIIGETKFEILEANMDKTTGKTKVKLLNIQ